MEEKQLERIANSLEELVILMKSKQKREINETLRKNKNSKPSKSSKNI